MPNCFHPMPYLLQFISSTRCPPRSWIFRPPSMVCPPVCHSPRHWCFLLGYLVVWHLYTFIKINVTSFICVHYVASSWAMVLIKKSTDVMILPPGDFMWLWTYISWRLIYSFLLRHQILLFMGRQMVKSWIAWDLMEIFLLIPKWRLEIKQCMSMPFRMGQMISQVLMS